MCKLNYLKGEKYNIKINMYYVHTLNTFLNFIIEYNTKKPVVCFIISPLLYLLIIPINVHITYYIRRSLVPFSLEKGGFTREGHTIGGHFRPYEGRMGSFRVQLEIIWKRSYLVNDL